MLGALLLLVGKDAKLQKKTQQDFQENLGMLKHVRGNKSMNVRMMGADAFMCPCARNHDYIRCTYEQTLYGAQPSHANCMNRFVHKKF